MDIVRKAIELIDTGESFSIGTVVHAQGSTPQKSGCKALLTRDGRQWGTLGGGMVEAEGLERMRQSIGAGKAELFEFRLDNDYSRAAGPICGGVMRILADPGASRNAEHYRAAVGAADRRERGLLVTTLGGDDPGNVIWLREDQLNGACPLPNGEALARQLREESPGAVSLDPTTEVFVEPIIAPPRLLVVGGGHVGQVVVQQAAAIGFDVTLADDRPEFSRPELFPEGTRCLSGDLRKLVAEFPQDRDTYIVLVSKGHRPDAEALEACIHGNAGYIGMIGSRRKIRFLKKHFIETALCTEAEWDRIAAPIGLDIGAVTVPEIGVSIAAQLIAARRLGRLEGRAKHLIA